MDERELRLLEDRARAEAGAVLRSYVDTLTRTVTAVYIAAAGDTRHKLPQAAQDTLRAALGDILDEMADRDHRAVRNALYAAAREAMEGGAGDLGEDVRATLPLDIRDELTALTVDVKAQLRAAAKLARRTPLERYGDVLTVVGSAKKALNRADRAAVFVVHRAHNEGVSRAIDALYARGEQVYRLWRAERDACSVCLGYAGALAEPGEPFHPVFMVADASAVPHGPVWGPPLHPWCRCGISEWSGNGPADLNPVDLPHALRREAQRSILRGDAQGSAPARLRAADRLVDLATVLLVPKTVVKRARRAVQAGTFER